LETSSSAEQSAVSEFTRAYLQAIGCVLRRDREWDGFSVAVTAQAPLSPGSLALFLAAARDLYEVLDRRRMGRAEQGAPQLLRVHQPDVFGGAAAVEARPRPLRAEYGCSRLGRHRSENRAATQHRPIGYFRARGQIWQPRVAGEARAVRVLIGAAIRYMIDVAPLRERVILRLLNETGARLHEVLSMTAGGYRKGHSQLVGVRALLRNKGSLGREIKPVSFEAETDYLLHRYVRTERCRHEYAPVALSSWTTAHAVSLVALCCSRSQLTLPTASNPRLLTVLLECAFYDLYAKAATARARQVGQLIANESVTGDALRYT
jgi:hypothetical protein